MNTQRNKPIRITLPEYPGLPIFALLAMVYFVLAPGTPAQTATNDTEDLHTLTLIFDSVSVRQGYLMVALHNRADTYLSTTRLPYRRLRIPINNTRIQIPLVQIPTGEYSVTVYQDLNSNMRLDTNWVGMPTEPYGFSRNPDSNLGPPDFNETVFSLNANRTMHIRLIQ